MTAHCWPIAAAQTYGGVLVNSRGDLLLRSPAFFLLQVDHEQPAAFGAETQAIAWVSLSHAKAKVALSTNQLGRQRDLAIIAAVEQWFLSCLPLALLGRFPTVQSDWNNRPLTERHCKIDLHLHFSRLQMAHIMLGYLPEETEHKWFCYFSDKVLYQHRSWTGTCIDQIFLQSWPMAVLRRPMPSSIGIHRSTARRMTRQIKSGLAECYSL